MTPTLSTTIAENVERVLDRVAAAAVRSGRDASAVTLVGITKTHPAEYVVEGVRAGLRHVGENRIQEATPKIERVSDLLREAGIAAPAWHLVGHLQTNKAAAAIRYFQLIESVDSVRLAETLDRRVAAGVLPILLEVYIGDDPDRPGFRPHELEDAVGRIAALSALEVRGLMTVAPLGWDPTAARAAFHQVRELRDALVARYPRVHFGELSMGMTDDFELAVEEGSTSVRIGRALFGARAAA
jgi:pyridoxal phosphate enzyme (YggS family)